MIERLEQKLIALTLAAKSREGSRHGGRVTCGRCASERRKIARHRREKCRESTGEMCPETYLERSTRAAPENCRPAYYESALGEDCPFDNRGP